MWEYRIPQIQQFEDPLMNARSTQRLVCATAPVALPLLAQEVHLPLGGLTSNTEIVPRNQRPPSKATSLRTGPGRCSRKCTGMQTVLAIRVLQPETTIKQEPRCPQMSPMCWNVGAFTLCEATMLFTRPPTTYFCFFSLVLLSLIAQICVFPLIQLDKNENAGVIYLKNTS